MGLLKKNTAQDRRPILGAFFAAKVGNLLILTAESWELEAGS